MAIKKKKMSPRQKMINLMYVVLMAMLALNVSSDVLDAFRMVDNGLTRSTKNSSALNKNIYSVLDKELRKDPEKAREIHGKAQKISVLADAIYNYIDSLKWQIAKEVDGDDADVHNLRNRDNLEAANQIMLSPQRGKGDNLKASIDRYRDKILEVVVDSVQKELIADNLDTSVPEYSRGTGKGWKEYLFENTPACAAITILSKLQNDVRYSETQVLHELINNSDLDIDVDAPGRQLHVDAIDAYVIPNATTIVRGSKFKARVVVGSIDTQQHPSIYVGNTLLKTQDGVYETLCSSVGTHKLSGYVLAVNGDGKVVKKEFTQEYTVVEPAATVSATMMNVLYAGYQNPVSVSVPGVPSNQVSLSMTGGSLSRGTDGNYIAVPEHVGTDVVFTVSATQEGHSTTIGTFPFKVRKLPDPTPYIEYKDGGGNPIRYKGGGKSAIPKKYLVNAAGLSAAIDDGLLDIQFKVTGFKVYFVDRMGQFVARASQDNQFTDQQKALMRQLSGGKHCFISEIEVVGPDGIKRTLETSLDAKVN